MKGHDFQGVNAAYVAELFDRYREDPASAPGPAGPGPWTPGWPGPILFRDPV